MYNAGCRLIVKLTPNIHHVLYSRRAPKRGGGRGGRWCGCGEPDQTTIKLYHPRDPGTCFAPERQLDGKGTHGGYLRPAVKPIALNMVAEIARPWPRLIWPISGIGGVTTWRDADRVSRTWGGGTCRFCYRRDDYGFKSRRRTTASAGTVSEYPCATTETGMTIAPPQDQLVRPTPVPT